MLETVVASRHHLKGRDVQDVVNGLDAVAFPCLCQVPGRNSSMGKGLFWSFLAGKAWSNTLAYDNGACGGTHSPPDWPGSHS